MFLPGPLLFNQKIELFFSSFPLRDLDRKGSIPLLYIPEPSSGPPPVTLERHCFSSPPFLELLHSRLMRLNFFFPSGFTIDSLRDRISLLISKPPHFLLKPSVHPSPIPVDISFLRTVCSPLCSPGKAPLVGTEVPDSCRCFAFLFDIFFLYYPDDHFCDFTRSSTLGCGAFSFGQTVVPQASHLSY